MGSVMSQEVWLNSKLFLAPNDNHLLRVALEKSKLSPRDFLTVWNRSRGVPLHHGYTLESPGGALKQY